MANVDRLPNYEQMERLITAVGSPKEATSFGGASDNMISYFIEQADKGNIDLRSDLGWEIGDTRIASVGSTPFPLVLAAYANEYELVNPTPNGDTHGHFIVCPTIASTSTGVPNGTPVGDYVKSPNFAQVTSNNTKNVFDSAGLLSVAKYFKMRYVIDTVDGSSHSFSLSTYNTNLGAPSAKELFGNDSNGTDIENALYTQWPYMEDVLHRIFPSNWIYTRSPAQTQGTSGTCEFSIIRINDGTPSQASNAQNAFPFIII